jgi:two-component system, NarL family, response regulator NreC
MSIRILIADDHKIVRDGLSGLIRTQKDMEIIGEADNGMTAVKLASNVSPDIVIMDVSMPDLNGIEATRKIKSAVPDAKVIALSMHSDRRFVLGMLEAGVKGYVIKDSAFAELAGAIRAVSANKSYLSPGITDIVVNAYARNGEVKGNALLSNREREILQLLAEGRSVKKISELIHISIKTVETHRRNIMVKLDIKTAADLIRYALKEGYSTLE